MRRHPAGDRPSGLSGFLLSLLFWSASAGAQVRGQDALALRLDTAEAAVVLAILERHAAGHAITDADWQRLFTAEAYVRLKAREASLHRDFTDSGFARFVLSDSLGRRRAELRRALREWAGADLRAASARALAYLPPDACIRATVYIVIKPHTNSFVYEVLTNPAIFLYLDPIRTGPQFENTVAHELHHIGLASVTPRADSMVARLPDRVRLAAQWMGAFGEGFAMLAAAGGPEVHPHAVSPPQEQARWDRDLANYRRDFTTLDQFFRDVIGKRLATEDTVNAVAFSFFGEQGPWYTVGWKLAVVIERRYGRAALIQCMLDPWLLATRYNAAAGDSLPLWSAELLNALRPGAP